MGVLLRLATLKDSCLNTGVGLRRGLLLSTRLMLRPVKRMLPVIGVVDIIAERGAEDVWYVKEPALV